MQPDQWAERTFSRAQAAELAAIHPDRLDVLIHRMRHCAVLFSERRGTRRIFSARDIAVLRVAYEIERGGRTWLNALAVAFDHTEAPPPPDAVLVLTPTPVRDSGGPVVMPRHAVPPVERDSMLIVPIGAVVADILNRIGSR